MGLALAALFAWAAVWQVLQPWQVRLFVLRRGLFALLTALPQLVFHADFYGVLPAVAVAAADACGAACVGAASVTLLRAASQPLKPDALPHAEPPRTAAALAIATSAFWGIAWVRLLRLRATQADAAAASDALKLLWLPMAPLYTLLCEHIERSVQDTDATVRQLRRCCSAAGPRADAYCTATGGCAAWDAVSLQGVVKCRHPAACGPGTWRRLAQRLLLVAGRFNSTCLAAQGTLRRACCPAFAPAEPPSAGPAR